jgi:sterol 14-demethylase
MVVALNKQTPPMLNGLPFIGNALDFGEHRDELFRRGYEQHGSVFGVKLGTQPVAVMIGPENHEIFFTKTDKELRMDKAYGFLAAMFGKIAFTASPETYIEQRPVLHLPFGRTKMMSYVPIMQEEIQIWLNSLPDNGEMDITTELIPVIQNVAAHAIMGREFRHRMGREFWNLYMDLSKGLDPMLPPNLPLPKFIQRDKAKAKMRAILKPILEERRNNPEAHDDFLQDFVNARLKDGSEVSDEVIEGLILALMFAGHETTLGQAAWSVIQLLQNPTYLRFVQAEIAEKAPYGAMIELNTLAKLQYTFWAVQETARMKPSADMVMRYVEEDIEVGDYVIPAGWLAIVAAGTAHFLPDLFKNPYSYDPLRYAEGREEDRQHRFAMIGFGGGIHKCTGMNFAMNEMLVITTMLFQQFDLELLTDNPRIEHGMGANRPQTTRIRYQRRKLEARQAHPTADSESLCPHIPS